MKQLAVPMTQRQSLPMAAVKAVEQQPMDLVKRNQRFRRSAAVYTCERYIPSRIEDEARQPLASQSASNFKPSKVNQEQVVSNDSENLVFQTVPKLSQGKREILSRWRRENPHLEQEDEQTSKAESSLSSGMAIQSRHLPSCGQHQWEENSKDILQTEEANSTKEIGLDSQQDKELANSIPDDDQEQQYEQYVYTLLSEERCSTLNSTCETESQESGSHEQGEQLIVLEREDEFTIKGNGSGSEDDSPVSSVENLDAQCPEGSTKINGPDPDKGQVTVCQSHSMLHSSTEDDGSAKVTQESIMSESSSSEKDTDFYNDDSDRDEGLVIVDGTCQVVDFDCGTDDLEIVTETSDNDDIHKEDSDKEDEDNQDPIPRSKSRSESQRKMKEGKSWLLNNFQVLEDTKNTKAVIKLSAIEKSYISYCKENRKDPLATPVLARIIHSTFPNATKCRLGPRKHQQIHYRRLQFKSDVAASNQQVPELTKDKQTENQCNSQKDQSETKSASKLQHSGKAFQEINREQTTTVVDNGMNTQSASLLEVEEVNHQNPQNENSSSQNDEENCKRSAAKIKEVLQWITSQGESHKSALLRDFAHSASCQKLKCEPVCLMFRRIRRHVVAAQHSCSVLRLYSMLLRHHVSSCTQSNCGLPACPALRNTCSSKRKQGEEPKQPAKRVFTAHSQSMYPSSLVLAPRSPGGSLPGSPVNSPPASPNSVVGITPITSQIQYVMVPVLMPLVENQVI
ncbi:uncharacterized protein LOC135197785 isoform X2 [Macrobrachium nipponense]|uniref:uncharacterized protein LOC135197785 isoform X2 n=1 Tax=Macrobrachium nipponense TaxID=159736 RepID=UPI0030C7CBD6